LVEAKGFDNLLKAVNGLPINLLIIGEGPQRPELEAQIKTLNSNTHCHLLGQREDVAALIASTDAVLISSRREGFSYVFCEALMLEKRILSTDVPVANEVLPSELITAVSDSKGFRARLTALLDDMPRWSALMQKPQKKARQHMTLAAMSANTISVYESVITDQPC
jgi:glycosyltransferase involved in cell wall biosynthesis